MYFVTCVLLLLCVLVGTFILRSRLGKVLVAIRDREDRVRFSGYDPALFKAFIFAVAALFSVDRRGACSPCRSGSPRLRWSASCPRSRW